jgi:hypothetical protein
MPTESQSFPVQGLRQINFALASVNLLRDIRRQVQGSDRLTAAAAKESAPPLVYAEPAHHLEKVEVRTTSRFLMETGRYGGIVSLMTSNDVCRGKTRPGILRCLREQ